MRFLPLAWLQFSELPLPDAGPNESEHWMANVRGHAADLPVPSLGYRNPQPCIGDCLSEPDGRDPFPEGRGLFKNLYHCREGHAVIQEHAGPELMKGLFRGYALHLDEIGLWRLVFRPGYKGLDMALVRERNEAFAVVIEPSGDIHPGNGDEIRKGPPPFGIRKLAEDAEGLVKKEHPGIGVCFFSLSFFHGV